MLLKDMTAIEILQIRCPRQKSFFMLQNAANEAETTLLRTYDAGVIIHPDQQFRFCAALRQRPSWLDR